MYFTSPPSRSALYLSAMYLIVAFCAVLCVFFIWFGSFFGWGLTVFVVAIIKAVLRGETQGALNLFK